MIAFAGWLNLVLLAQFTPPENPVLSTLIKDGVTANGVAVPLPAPTLLDGQDAAAGRAALSQVAGDERSVANLVRDSVSAPFVLKTRDVRAKDATIRVADLWFVVRGDLAEIDLKPILNKTAESSVEAGNMRFTSKVLSAQDLKDRPLDRLPALPGRDEWYTHATGRLLDRIKVAATDQVVATRTADSLTLAARTAPRFDADPTFPNHWATIDRGPAGETTGTPQVYAGGGSYVKITRLVAEPGALFVEAHFAFVEPQPWFAGNPILRSKFSVIAQDQVRQLRRDIQKRRAAK